MESLKATATTALAFSFLLPLAAASPARAGELHQAHTIIVSAERLTTAQYVVSSALNNDSINVSTEIYVFPGPIQARTPFNVPRLAVDCLAANHFTLGASLIVAHTEGSYDTLILANPRIGAMFPLSPAAEFWVRAGITYYQESGVGTKSGYGADIEAAFVFKVGDHLGVTLSALGDLGLHDSNGVDYANLGASGGLVGWF